MNEQKVKLIDDRNIFFKYPDSAMHWLTTNKNVFTIMSYLLFRKNFRLYYFVKEALEDDEVLIKYDDLNIKPKLTKIQFKRSFENLAKYGFIEILKYKPKIFTPGLIKIKILVDIFDPEISKLVKDYQNFNGVSYFR